MKTVLLLPIMATFAANCQETTQQSLAEPGCIIVKHKGTVGRRLIFTALILVPIAPGAKYELVDSMGFRGARLTYTGKELQAVEETGVHVVVLQNKYQTSELASARQACSALPQRDWRTATLTATAFAVRDLGTKASVVALPGWTGAPGIAVGRATREEETWEGFELDTGDLVFDAACVVQRDRMPDVTVHGPLKYAMSQDDLYIHDRKGREFRLVVLQKSLKTASAAGKN
jgi:hypothetical protein